MRKRCVLLYEVYLEPGWPTLSCFVVCVFSRVVETKYLFFINLFIDSSLFVYFFWQNFYLDLRRQHHSADSTPITTRQLESLIRLTQVRNSLLKNWLKNVLGDSKITLTGIIQSTPSNSNLPLAWSNFQSTSDHFPLFNFTLDNSNFFLFPLKVRIIAGVVVNYIVAHK